MAWFCCCGSQATCGFCNSGALPSSVTVIIAGFPGCPGVAGTYVATKTQPILYPCRLFFQINGEDHYVDFSTTIPHIDRVGGFAAFGRWNHASQISLDCNQPFSLTSWVLDPVGFNNCGAPGAPPFTVNG